MLDATTFGYLEIDEASRSSSFVRVAADGSVTRTAGGNGRLAALGGPMSPRRSPFTRDGRFLVQAELECEDDCALAILDRYPMGAEVAPVDRVPIAGAGWNVQSIALSEDGRRVAVCTHDAALVFDRDTRAARTIPLEGVCMALSPDRGVVLVAPTEEHEPGLRRVDLASAEAREGATTVRGGAAIDACGTSAVAFGRVDATTQRIERVFFDGRRPETLFEGPAEPTWMTDVQIDERGWVLVVGEDDRRERGFTGAWIVPLAGGATTTIAIDTGAQVFEVALGPTP
jgi:hypothetical protein